MARAASECSAQVIGMDPNHSALVEVSRRATRVKGPKPVFVLGAWEDLPGPFAGRVSSATVLFPWGSLLRAVGEANRTFAQHVSELSCDGSLTLEIVTALHPVADASELGRLGLDGLSAERMREAWESAGARVELRSLPVDHAYQTTWWRKIKQREGREPTLLRVTLP